MLELRFSYTKLSIPKNRHFGDFLIITVDAAVRIFYHISMMRTLELKTVVWKEGKFYVAQCLNVDVSSFGKTKKEALANIKEALELYFEDEPASKLTEVEKPELIRLSLAHA